MQQDVRRSDSTEGTARSEPEPAEKPGFARSLFRFGGKKKRAPAAEPARLTDRLKEVLERDRALIASQPEPELGEDGAHEVHDEEAWPDPFTVSETFHAPEPFGGADPFGTAEYTGTRPTSGWTEEPATASNRISEIASWIEEEIGGHAEGALAIEAPLNADEAAELDAVLGEGPLEVPTENTVVSESPLADAPPAVEAGGASAREHQNVEEKPRAPSSRAQVKAKVSARPAPREAEAREPAEAGSREPINTLTMARLLAMQGYKPRALTVYRELLKRSPDDEALRTEFEALKNSTD